MLGKFYVRKEPTNDSILIEMAPLYRVRRKDVCFYRDKECTDFVFRIPWHHTGKPTRNSTSTMYNCYRYSIEWVDDIQVTKVIFRKYPEGGIIALFPEEAYKRTYTVMCYQHIGQHGEAGYNGVVASTKLATSEEYEGLKQELESIGYIPDVRKRAKINYR